MGHLDTEKLRSYHRAWVRPDRISLAISGPVSEKQVRELVEGIERAFEKQEGGANLSILDQIQPNPLLAAPRWVDRSFDREQTHVILGGNGIENRSTERFAVRLLQTILGGQSGRLFIELREKKSLAYTVAPVGFEGIEPGFLGGYIACSPEKAQEAIKGFQAVFEKLAKSGPTEAEMNRAKEFYIGRRSMDLQSDPSLSKHLGVRQHFREPSL